ncbi:hypothetical protein BJ944DRAFT_274189 [Cunninghamella echinulata]|nr:hypothetical protein BJ944DRAFT_274189 [Cunninghamella echinulata]
MKNEKEEKEESAFYIDKDDHWELQPLDRDAYQYWLQGWQSVTALKRIRHQWDYYLINDDDQPSSSLHSSNDYKIPPFWVTPPPPSHPIWASYLEKN